MQVLDRVEVLFVIRPVRPSTPGAASSLSSKNASSSRSMLMWWRSAVTVFLFFALLLAVCAPAPVTRFPELCARPVLCWRAFPLASALGSTAPRRIAPPCSSVLSYYGKVNFPRPYIIGYGSSPSRCGLCRQRAGSRTWVSPVPAHGACVHARFFDHAGSPEVLALALLDILPSTTQTASAPRN